MSLNEDDLFELLAAFAVVLRRVAMQIDAEAARPLVPIIVACEIIAPKLPGRRPGFTSRDLEGLVLVWKNSQTWKIGRPTRAVHSAWCKRSTGYLKYIAYQVSSATRSRSATPVQLVEVFGEIGAELARIRRRANPALAQRLETLETLCRAISPRGPRHRSRPFDLIRKALERHVQRSMASPKVAEGSPGTSAPPRPLSSDDTQDRSDVTWH